MTPVVALLAKSGFNSISEAMKSLGLEEAELNTCMCSLELLQPVQQSCLHTRDNLASGGSSHGSIGAQEELVDYSPLFMWWQSQAVGTMQSLEVCSCCSSVCSLGPQLPKAFNAV